MKGCCNEIVNLISAVILVTWISLGYSDIELDRKALLYFKEKADLEHVLAANWTGSNPCTDNWEGVTCDPQISNGIVRLELEGKNLIGTIPIDSIGHLTELRVLSLKGNRLTGSIPSDLPRCRNLKKLYLNLNQFDGELPGTLFALQRLDRLDLSNNKLSGSIPASVLGMQKLITLRLQLNSLTGQIPDVTNLPLLTDFDVSWNKLSGPIPAAVADKFPSSFSGNPDLCGRPLSKACPSKKTKKLSKQVIAIIAVAASLVLLTSLSALLLCYKCRKSPAPAVAKVESEPGDTKKKAADIVFVTKDDSAFELMDLLQASAELLGKGKLGNTYKAVCSAGFVVAVKRLVDRTGCSKAVFERRMGIVGRMTHPNLLPLKAYYFYAKNEKLLVYDYIRKGSLHAVLHECLPPASPLSWSMRLKIARGIASCLSFLHHQCKLPHGNVKTSNVLLTDKYVPRISDFGLLPYLPPDEALESNGYRAPECRSVRDVTRRTDVYSFGVVLLELLTGKLPEVETTINRNSTKKLDLPSWVIATVNEEWTTAVFDNVMDASKQEQMVALLKVALLCVSRSREQRPKMNEVVQMIEEVDEVVTGYY